MQLCFNRGPLLARASPCFTLQHHNNNRPRRASLRMTAQAMPPDSSGNSGTNKEHGADDQLQQPGPATPSEAGSQSQLPARDAGSSCRSDLEAPLLPVAHHVAPNEAAGWSWKGAKLRAAAGAVGLGIAVRLLSVPQGLSDEAWSLLAIFVTTIAGLVLGPLPVGAWSFVCLTAAVATHTLTLAQAFSAASSPVVWLVCLSFFFAKGFEKTGLGERVALAVVSTFGSSTLALGMSLTGAEALLAPAMPSTTARAVIFVPVITSLSAAVDSCPGDASRLRMGAYLTHSQFQASAHSSNLFLTAAAQNLLCIQLATNMGVHIPSPFLTWAAGGCVPGLVGLLATPCLVYLLMPPSVKQTPEAPVAAKAALQQLGRFTQDEMIMMAAILVAVLLWVSGDHIGVAPVTAAMIALSMLLLTGVLEWRDCVSFQPAWDTLWWFSALLSMSNALTEMGVVRLASDSAAAYLQTLHLSWPSLFMLLHLMFYGCHYLFASQTAHVGALYPTALGLMVASGVPPQLAALTLAFNVNLFGSLTHYASGQAAVYYGSGFVELKEVFKIGAACAVMDLTIWGVLGMAWWKFLGWY